MEKRREEKRREEKRREEKRREEKRREEKRREEKRREEKPARSPDFNSVDFYLWDHLKQLVYAAGIPNAEILHKRVMEAYETFRHRVGVGI
ncbi:hypothetical protein ANN_01600 [Periplaneta americana]|uniref:Uncharacterized protein n=1 Tax=Periplaneta americana TaxID=6978 RepID=A0ABQ8TU01_PERAM|nr:hypothetical protein ANN_01600 [Periplaneta americana]